MTIFLVLGTSNIVLGVERIGDAFLRVEVRIAYIPGVTNIFLDQRRIRVFKAKAVVGVDNARRHVAICHLEVLALENTPSNIATAAATEAKSLGISASDDLGVGEHGGIDPIADLTRDGIELVKLLFRRNECRTTRNERHDMRHLATDETADLRCFSLHVQSFEVVSRADEVCFRIELVSLRSLTIEEPTTAEDGELTVVRELGERAHQGLEVGAARSACSLHEVVSLAHVCVERIEWVDIVECSERVEPQDMAVQELTALYQVTDDTSLVRDDDAISSFTCER